jgi:hypothetical protein
MVKFTDAFGRIISDGARCVFGGTFPEQMPAKKRNRYGVAKIMNGTLKFFVPMTDGNLMSSGLYWDYDGENCHDLMLV